MLSFEFFRHFLVSPRAGSLVRSIARTGIVGITFGVTALVLVISVMNGFNRSIRDKMISIEPHLVVSFPAGASFDDIRQSPIYAKLASEKGAQPHLFAQQDVVFRTEEGKIKMATLKGVSREALKLFYDFMAKKDWGYMDSEFSGVEDLQPGELIFGLTLAKETGVFTDNSVTLIPPENLLLPLGEVPIYTVAKVRDFIMVEHEPVDTNTIFYVQGESLPRLQHTTGIERGIEVYLDDPDQADAWKSSIVAMGGNVQTWMDRNSALFFALKVEKVVIGILVSLSTLFAALSIISVMVLLLIQKRRDLGNFLAMGMSQKQVKTLFLRLGMYLSAIGLMAGLFFGVVLCLLVDNLSEGLLPAWYEETNIPAEIHGWQIFSFLSALFVFTYLSLWWALRHLSKLNPSKALRGI